MRCHADPRRQPGRRTFLRALAALPASLPLAGGAAAAQATQFQLGWNHPWIAYGHDFGPAWGHDGVSTGGWTPETHVTTRGFTRTELVRDPATGRGALRISTDLIGGHSSRSNGEVHLSVLDHWPFACPPVQTPSSLNLDGALVRYRVRLPHGSAGPPSEPNGLQIVFKTHSSDGVWPSMYTRWENISPSWEGREVELLARVSVAEAAHVDPGFDAARVSLLGLKMGMTPAAAVAITDPIHLGEIVIETDPPLSFDFEQHELERDIRIVRDRSGDAFSIVRVFVFGDGRASPAFGGEGRVIGLDDRFFSDFDALVEIAERTDVRLMPVLLDFQWLARPRVVSGVQLGGHSAVIREPVLRQTFLDRALRPLLERYARRDAIYAWDIINEPEWGIRGIPGAPADTLDLVSYAQMHQFAGACAQYIHRYAPLQLATLGSARRGWVPMWKALGLDLYQFHWYDRFERHEPFPWRPFSELHLDRPCIVGEVPTAGTRYTPQQFISAAAQGGYSGLLLWSYRARDQASNFCGAMPRDRLSFRPPPIGSPLSSVPSDGRSIAPPAP